VGTALVVGLAAGIVLTALAGARRTDSAYPRFLRAQRAFDVFVGGGTREGLERAAQLPEVATSMIVASARGVVVGSHDTEPVDASTGTDDRLGRTFNRFKMLHGRLADPRRDDELVASFVAAKRYGLRVGHTARVRFERPEGNANSLGPSFSGSAPAPPGAPAEPAGPVVVRLRVVGIEATPSEFPPNLDVDPGVHLTAAFGRAHPEVLESDYSLLARLRRGPAGASAFARAVGEVSPEGHYFFFQRDQAANVQRSIHLQAVALYMLAALVGLVVTLVLAQVLARQTALEADDHAVLQSLGMGRGQLWLVSLARALPAAVGGAVVAALVAVALSPLFPRGLARTAEPGPGVHLDVIVVLAGGVAVAVLVLLLTALPAWRAATSATLSSDSDERPRPSALGEALQRAPLGPSAVIGLRLAVERGRGRTAVALRSGVVATAVALAALAGAITFGGSLSHLLDTPRLYGQTWDVTYESGTERISNDVIPHLLTDRRVAAIAGMASGPRLQVDSLRTDVVAFDVLKGRVGVVLQGHLPHGPNELLLGSVTLRKLGKHVGDRVRASLTGLSTEPHPFRIVGRGVFPPRGENARLGEGAIIATSGFGALLPPGVLEQAAAEGDTGLYDSAAVAFRPGVNATRAADSLVDDPEVQVTTADRPTDLVNFGRVEGLPLILALLLGALAAAVTAHVLVTSVRRRRRDLAILKTLGLLPRQVRAAVAWQATTLAAAGVVVALPVGVAAGRWGWTGFAGRLGVVPQPVVPLLAVLLIVPATLLLANLVAAGPGWMAGRVPPASVLRAE
jgi:ABC-type lipoprotein release transport system permease subunit